MSDLVDVSWRRRSGCFSSRSGWSRWDLLVVLVVLGIGLLLLFPYLFGSRLQARRQFCEYRQMSLGRALLRYESQNGEFPAYRDFLNPLQEDSASIGWTYAILPYVGVSYDANNPAYGPKEDPRRGPWEKIQQEYGPSADPEKQRQITTIYIPELVCPDDLPPQVDKGKKTIAWSSYVVNGGLPDAQRSDGKDQFPVDWPANGMFLDGLSRSQETIERVTVESIQQADGTANTLMLSENLDSGLWTDDQESQLTFLWVANTGKGKLNQRTQLLRLNQRAGEGQRRGKLLFARPSSRHRGGVNVVYADGHTEFLSDQIDYVVYVYKMTADSRNLRHPGTDQPIGPPYQHPDVNREEAMETDSAVDRQQ